MGNFIFDQTFSSEVKRGAVIDATLTFADNYDFGSWEQVAETCSTNRAGCLASAATAKLAQAGADWKFDYHAVLNNGKDVTSLGDATLQKAVGERLKWASTMKALGQ